MPDGGTVMARMKPELPVTQHDSEQAEPERHDKHSEHF